MLKLQSFGHLMQRADSLEKTQMLGKIEGGRRREWQRMRWLDGITDSMDMSWENSRSWRWTGRPGVLQSMESPRVRYNWATELNYGYKSLTSVRTTWLYGLQHRTVYDCKLSATIYNKLISSLRKVVTHIPAFFPTKSSFLSCTPQHSTLNLCSITLKTLSNILV